MRCIFCGHDTRGPWSFCDQTCESDYHDALTNHGEDCPEANTDDSDYATYEPCDEPEPADIGGEA